MQFGVGQNLVPSVFAAGVLIKDHSVAAAAHAAAAVKATDGANRLDEAVRSMLSFDHAIDNTRKLPVDIVWPSIRKYYAGYDAAKQAVMMLVQSGVVPGARDIVGRTSLQAAKEAFSSSVQAAYTQTGDFRRFLADGWLDATIEDAINGTMMLDSGNAGRDLMGGIGQVRDALRRNAPLDPNLVHGVEQMFDRLGARLQARVDSATGSAAKLDRATLDRSGSLLATTQRSASEMSVDADAALARMRQAG